MSTLNRAGTCLACEGLRRRLRRERTGQRAHDANRQVRVYRRNTKGVDDIRSTGERRGHSQKSCQTTQTVFGLILESVSSQIPFTANREQMSACLVAVTSGEGSDLAPATLGDLHKADLAVSKFRHSGSQDKANSRQITPSTQLACCSRQGHDSDTIMRGESADRLALSPHRKKRSGTQMLATPAHA
jgi:hypothetical protein